jgi:MFS family permease
MSVLAAVLIAPILPQMQAHFAEVPRVEFLVPVALTAPGLVIAVLSLVVGVMADRFGRRRLLVAGLTLYAVFGMAPIWLDSLPAILATRIGVGFTEAVIMTCATALIGDYFHGLQRERYLALNTTFASTSAVIFIAVGGALGEFGWRVPFGVYAISLLLAPAILWLLWEPQRHEVATEATPGEADSRFRVGHQLLICAVTLVGGVVFMAVQVHIGYLMNGVGVTSPQTIGVVASFGQVAVVAGSLLFRVLLRARLATVLRLGLSFGLAAAGFLIVGSASSFEMAVAGALVAGLGNGILLPTLQCWNMCDLSAEHRALGTGAWMAAYFLGMFLTPLVVVGIAGQVGGIGPALKLMGGVVLPCAAALLVAGLSFGRSRFARPEAPACPITHP